MISPTNRGTTGHLVALDYHLPPTMTATVVCTEPPLKPFGAGGRRSGLGECELSGGDFLGAGGSADWSSAAIDESMA